MKVMKLVSFCLLAKMVEGTGPMVDFSRAARAYFRSVPVAGLCLSGNLTVTGLPTLGEGLRVTTCPECGEVIPSQNYVALARRLNRGFCFYSKTELAVTGLNYDHCGSKVFDIITCRPGASTFNTFSCAENEVLLVGTGKNYAHDLLVIDGRPVFPDHDAFSAVGENGRAVAGTVAIWVTAPQSCGPWGEMQILDEECCKLFGQDSVCPTSRLGQDGGIELNCSGPEPSELPPNRTVNETVLWNNATSDLNETLVLMNNETFYNETPTPNQTGTSAPIPVPESEGFSSSSICFSGAVSVFVQGKGPVAMENLQVGDIVQTETNGSYERVYGFAHYNPTKKAEFFQISSAGNEMPIEMSGDHLIFLKDRANPVAVSSLQVGDILVSATRDGAEVTKIQKVTRTGIYAPLTPSGKIFVASGIQASCYVTLQVNSKEHVELQGGYKTVPYHQYIQVAMTPLRMLCMGVSTSFCTSYNEDGFPSYVAMALWINKWAGHQSPWVHAIVLIIIGLATGPVFVLEGIVGALWVPWVIAFVVTAVFWKADSWKLSKEDLFL